MTHFQTLCQDLWPDGQIAMYTDYFQLYRSTIRCCWMEITR